MLYISAEKLMAKIYKEVVNMEITVAELERKIFELEEVRVVIRKKKEDKVSNYRYERKASMTSSITDLIDNRIKPLIGDAEVIVINGEGLQPHGRTKVETVRNSYA
jgi:hypothetical protein